MIFSNLSTSDAEKSIETELFYIDQYDPLASRYNIM